MENNGVFITPMEELEHESWRLALRQKSEVEMYREKQKQVIKDLQEYF